MFGVSKIFKWLENVSYRLESLRLTKAGYHTRLKSPGHPTAVGPYNLPTSDDPGSSRNRNNNADLFLKK